MDLAEVRFVEAEATDLVEGWVLRVAYLVWAITVGVQG